MKQEIEARGSSVEEAITSGLSKLRVSKEDVDIEILDEGRRAILGIGGRDAVVRLSLISVPDLAERSESTPEPVKAKTPPPASKETQVVAEKKNVKAEVDEIAVAPDTMPEIDETETAVTVISELLELMQVEAAISTRVTEPDDLTGKRLPVVDINGDDLGALIGPRGETLDSLQFISRLMVGHRIGHRSNFVIDIEGYRERREQALSRLAERMANKAVKRGSPVTLEPMPAYERRIIHMALRDSKDVKTESTGDGNRRRVRIFPLS